MFRVRVLGFMASLARRPQGEGSERRRGETLSMKIHVGNLPFVTTEAALRRLFEQHGAVDSVSVITDRATGRPRGFAFVEMPDASCATTAIQALDGRKIDGRPVRVSEAANLATAG
jgi:RNA recognition motif-containing protein